MRYDRTVIAYHGCDARVADALISGATSFEKSRNNYDWLGEGIYFWEFGFDRALRFAEFQRRRGKVQTPAVIGAVVQLGRCFDLMDTRHTSELRDAYALFRRVKRAAGESLPKNRGPTPDKLLRHRDCAVLNFYFRLLEDRALRYDSVRCAFTEGRPAFAGSGIRCQSHVQLAIRNPACIVGVFRPMIEVSA